ncbi:prepilin-type N-terminal cleavage/methylation domain-containing protein [Akkermansiaceae bacterium]|nr:prepilin-type N-terminal cleavage/methylation domain-containing protein [Akkermansiaceae bacterium]
MRTSAKKARHGFTLLELTVTMMVGMTIGALILAMLNQQVAFLKIFRAQSFLNEEAPIISNHVSKLLLNAERFRLHSSVADALAGTNPRLTDSPVCVLNFRQPDGTVRAGILSFENRGQGNALYYYVVPVSGVLTAPQWTITNKPSNVSFFVESGIIRTRLTGPAGEELTFSGAMQ